MINWIKNLFKKKEMVVIEEIKTCRHDWEIIKKYDFWYSPISHKYTNQNPTEYNPSCHKMRHSVNWYVYGYPYQITDDVCVKCGECHNGYKIMEKDNKAVQKRKELATKLWEDGCKNENN